MLVVSVAVTLGLIIAIIFFGLNYVRMLGSHQEANTAVQAAALAAAQDLSRIVVDTPQFGLVSLSDFAPAGQNKTQAPDDYDLPVRSINTLIGTARLEYIIGYQLGDPIMQALSQQDMQNTIAATSILETTLQAALKSGAIEQDVNKQPINVYADAESAYEQNQIHISGKSTYTPGTMVLTLGVLTQGVATNIPVPQPTASAPVNPSQQAVGNYLSETDVGFQGRSFVFASVGANSCLVDPSKFTTNLALANQVPAVVRVDVDELIASQYHPNGDVVHDSACGEPGSVYDPKPAPGAFSISFPDGPLQELTKPSDILTNPGLQKAGVNLKTAQGGDYPNSPPTSQMAPMSWMLPGAPVATDVFRAQFYDWVRRAGTKANIQSVEGMLSLPFAQSNATKDWITQFVAGGPQINITQLTSGPQIPWGIMHVYKFNQDGTVAYNGGTKITPWPLVSASESQMYGESLNALQTKSPAAALAFTNVTLTIKGQQFQHGGNSGNVNFTNQIDVYFRDECRQYGTQLGGWHGGEPLDDQYVAQLLKPELRNHIAMNGKHGTAYGAVIAAGGMGAKGPPGGGPGGSGGPGLGSVPLVGNQSDFDEADASAPSINYASGGSGNRPTYTTNGSAVDIRFRQQLQVNGSLAGLLTFDTGYLAEEF
jgi:hypothetical protein